MSIKKDPDIPSMARDMRRLRLRVMLLMRIKHGSSYSYALIKEMSAPRAASMLGRSSATMKNDIYNTLNALEKSGYVRVASKMEKNRVKKYYFITPRGRGALIGAKKLFLRSLTGLTKILK